MTAAFVITGDEWQALAAVDHLACRLYLVLRRCMDFRTGVVGGPLKAISWQALREHTEVPGRPGVRYFRPTEQQLRRRVEQLEKCGLLRRISEGLTLKFRMLLARTDSCVPKKPEGAREGRKSRRKPVVARVHGRAVRVGVRQKPTHIRFPVTPLYPPHLPIRRSGRRRGEMSHKPNRDPMHSSCGQASSRRTGSQSNHVATLMR